MNHNCFTALYKFIWSALSSSPAYGATDSYVRNQENYVGSIHIKSIDMVNIFLKIEVTFKYLKNYLRFY